MSEKQAPVWSDREVFVIVSMPHDHKWLTGPLDDGWMYKHPDDGISTCYAAQAHSLANPDVAVSVFSWTLKDGLRGITTFVGGKQGECAGYFVRDVHHCYHPTIMLVLAEYLSEQARMVEQEATGTNDTECPCEEHALTRAE